MRKQVLGIALCALAAYASLNWIEAHAEVVRLHVRGGAQDHYPEVFIVDEGVEAWIRADRPDRLWLASLQVDPRVVVQRAGRDHHYTATIWQGPRNRDRVNAMFRRKYGLVDVVTGWFWWRDAVPVHLMPRDP